MELIPAVIECQSIYRANTERQKDNQSCSLHANWSLTLALYFCQQQLWLNHRWSSVSCVNKAEQNMPVTLTRLQWFYFPKVFFFFLTQNHIEKCHLSREPKSHQLPVCLTKNLPAVFYVIISGTQLWKWAQLPHTGCCLNLLLESNSQSEDGGLKGKRDKIIWFRQWMNDVV